MKFTSSELEMIYGALNSYAATLRDISPSPEHLPYSNSKKYDALADKIYSWVTSPVKYLDEDYGVWLLSHLDKKYIVCTNCGFRESIYSDLQPVNDGYKITWEDAEPKPLTSEILSRALEVSPSTEAMEDVPEHLIKQAVGIYKNRNQKN